MSRATSFAAATAALVLFQQAPAAMADTKTDETAIRARIGEFTARWHDSDAQGLSMFWTTDGDFVNPDGLLMKGRPEIEGFYRQAFSMGYAGSTATATVDVVRFLAPDLAIVDGDFGITGATTPDHKSLPDEHGRYTAVLKKGGGQWWIIANREMEPLRRSSGQ